MVPTVASNAEAPAIIRIRRATAADLDGLIAFYRSHHAQRRRLTQAELWRWKFLLQPHEGAEVPFFILEANGAIAGGIGYIEVSLQCAARGFTAVLPVNYFIDARYRGLPAVRLLRAVLNGHDIVIGANASADAVRLLEKSGFVDLSAHVRAYSYSLRPKARFSPVASGRRFTRWLRRALTDFRVPGLDYRLADTLDEDFAQRCQATPGAGQYFLKNAAWLRWRYAMSPELHCQYVYQSRRGVPVSMAVVTVDRNRNELVVLDVLWAERGFIATIGLIDRLLSVAWNQGCAAVVSHALSAWMDRIFRCCLFKSAGSDLGFLVMARDETLRRTLADPRRWHFLLGDSDAY